jgi:putative flippase GtrA
MYRFLTISVSAFFLNSLLLSALLETGWLDPALAAIGSAAVIPVITFLASRFWGFNPEFTAVIHKGRSDANQKNQQEM